MKGQMRSAFVALVGVQAIHSIEEYHFKLYDRLPPARYISELVSSDRATGFAVFNVFLVVFGLWCWRWPVERGWQSAAIVTWAWAVVEVANGVGHVALAALTAGYFPGLFTAPVLIAAGGWLVGRLVQGRGDLKKLA